MTKPKPNPLRGARERAKREGRRVVVPVGGVPDLVARVSPSGTVSYFLRYRDAGGARRAIPFRADDVAAARKHARDVLAAARTAKLTGEGDPWKKRAEAKRARQGETIAKLATWYLAAAKSRSGAKLAPSTLTAYRRIIAARILPEFGTKLAAEVTRADIRKLVDSIRDVEGKPTHANRVLAVLKAMFSAAVKSERLGASPAAGLTAAPEDPRDRVHTDDELRRILAAFPGTSLEALGPFVTLTGLRIGEALALTGADIDAERKTITVRATRQKGGTRVVPLSKPAARILDGLDPERPFPGAYPKAGIKMVRDASGVADFRPHDLRTSMRSRAEDLRIPFEIAEAMLGHTPSKIVRTYRPSASMARLREAFDAWAREVARIESGAERGDVLPFGRQGASA